MSSQEMSIIEEIAEAGAQLRTEFFRTYREQLVDFSRNVAIRLIRGGKVLFCGNGGSAADSQHLAAEFVCRFRMDRPALPAIALTTDTSVLTAAGNDFGFSEIFSRQIKALAGEEDVVVGITTSGQSPNVVQALQEAGEIGAYRVGLTGKKGRDIFSHSDVVFHVDSEDTALIQEVHIAWGHVLCRMTEYFLFEAVDELQSNIQ